MQGFGGAGGVEVTAVGLGTLALGGVAAVAADGGGGGSTQAVLVCAHRNKSSRVSVDA